jgi:hypothetical protein
MKQTIALFTISILLIFLFVSCSNHKVSNERFNQTQSFTISDRFYPPPVPPPLNSPPVDGIQEQTNPELPKVGMQSRNPIGSRECLNLLPDQYKNGVIDMTSDTASPDSQTWYVTVKPKKNAFGLRYLEVQHGGIVKDSGFSIFSNFFWSHKPMLLNNSSIDSSAAYEIAKKEAATRGRSISYAIFQLKKDKKSCEPNWIVWCYSFKDRYLGLIEIRAADGSILSIRGFK